MQPCYVRRRGSATLWLIIWIPALMVLFVALTGVANLWLARVEVENGLEAAALAAVKHWGDANGGDTLVPRTVGVQYAAANCVRMNDLVIGTNYDMNAMFCMQPNPNQNLTCILGQMPPSGNLIFGAIDDSDPDNVIFDAGKCPGCGAGLVVFDASGSGNLNTAAHNEWGIAFHPTQTPTTLTITSVLIELHPGTYGNVTANELEFMFNDFVLSDNSTGDLKVRNGAPGVEYQQLDVFGLSPAQISFSYPDPDLTDPMDPVYRKLLIEFTADGGDDGFEVCDRLRFGQQVLFDLTGPGSGNLDDGDGIGEFATTVTVTFSDNSQVTGTFVNTTHTSAGQGCAAVPSTTTCPSGAVDNNGVLTGQVKHYVSPSMIDDIPCPPAAARNNNGQSIGSLAPGGEGKFGVRAQVIAPIRPLGGQSFVGKIFEQCVQSKTTAIYDCATRRPRLIRIDTFICPGPGP